MFCLYFNFNWIPASEFVVALFAQFLSRSFHSFDSIQNYISGIKLLHIMLNQNCLAFDNMNLKLALRGMKRTIGHVSKQALPITVDMLIQMYSLLDMSEVNHVVFWSIFTFAFFTMSRKSNLVITNCKQPTKCIRRRDVLMGNNMLLVLFTWSKTNQYGGRVHQVPLVRIKGSPLCPVLAYQRMCRILPLKSDAPAFCIVKRGAIKPVLYYDLHCFLRLLLDKLGYDSSLYSSHSFRRGAATFAFVKGVRPSLIQAIGDWSSDAYKNYVHLDLQDKFAAINVMSRV